MTTKDYENIKCSFCGRNANEVDLMLRGFNANICNICIEEAKKGEYNYSEETRLASLKALEGMLLLTEKEREKAKKYYWNELR